MTRRALVGLLLFTFACSDDPAPASPPATETPDGGAPSAELVTAEGDCEPGTRAAIGTKSCVPVGTTTCADGFAKDASGWGCAAVLPTDACTGATRPALGETKCVPVGDCSGAFPPANAIIVDPSLADGALDATHFRTLNDAVAAATSGATIALVDGEHVAAFTAVPKSVTIVGRCAEKTKVVPDAGGPGGMRFAVALSVKGLTFTGVDTAFEGLSAGAQLDLEDVVLEGSKARVVTLRNSAHASLRHVVVRGTVARTAGAQTIALLADGASSIDVEDSAILDSFDAAVAGIDEGVKVTLKRTVIADTTAGAIRAFEGSKVDVIESVVKRAGGIAVLALHKKGGYPQVTLTRSVVTETIPTTSTGNEIATPINAAYGAIVNLDDSTVSDTKGIGIYSAETAKITLTKSVVTRVTNNAQSSGNGATATHKGEVTLIDSAIVDTTALGIGAFTGGHARLERSLISTIRGTMVDGFSVGFALNATEQSTIDLVDSSIVDPAELGAAMTDEGTRLTLDKVLVSKSAGAKPGEYGHGVLAAYGSTIDVKGSIIQRQNGVALFYAGGSGTVSRSLVRANGIGAHVQEGSELVEVATAPETADALQLVVSADVQFVDNTTKTGAGALPLPGFAKAP